MNKEQEAEVLSELEIAANMLEIAVTFLEFHGRPSKALINCKDLLQNTADRIFPLLESIK